MITLTKTDSALLESLEEIVGHLGASLIQAIPSDDQIIIGHVRDAYQIAIELLRAEKDK